MARSTRVPILIGLAWLLVACTSSVTPTTGAASAPASQAGTSDPSTTPTDLPIPTRTAVRFVAPEGVAVGGNGDVYVADFSGEFVVRFAADRSASIFAGDGVAGFAGDGGPATAAMFAEPSGLALDTTGNLFIADHHNQRIREVTTDGTMQTFAGSGPTGSAAGGFAGDGGSAINAQFSEPLGLAIAPDGTIYVGDSFNLRVRRIKPDGSIDTVLGGGATPLRAQAIKGTSADLGILGYLALARDGTLYVSERSGPQRTGGARILRLDAAGMVSVVAGTNEPGYAGDGGPALAARLSDPNGITIDTAGNLTFCDSDNRRIRRIDSNGVITTIAGIGTVGTPVSGQPAVSSPIGSCYGLGRAADGTLFAADGEQGRILGIDATGILSVIGP